MKTEGITTENQKSTFDIFILADLALSLWLAYSFLHLWVAPAAGDVEKIYCMAALIAFEFIMVHSGVFMAVMPFKYSLLFFFPIYGIFAWVFNTFVPDNSICYLYLTVVLSRMRFAFFNTNEGLKQQNIGQSVYAAFMYFILIMLVAVSNELLPEFGLTPEFLEKSGYAYSVGGLFTEKPQTAMCLGFCYYIMMSLFYFAIAYSGIKKVFVKKSAIAADPDQ